MSEQKNEIYAKVSEVKARSYRGNKYYRITAEIENGGGPFSWGVKSEQIKDYMTKQGVHAPSELVGVRTVIHRERRVEEIAKRTSETFMEKRPRPWYLIGLLTGLALIALAAANHKWGFLLR